MKRRRMLTVLGMAGLVAGWLAIRWANGWAAPREPHGVTQGRLAGCPATPNCVSTESQRQDQEIAPLPLDRPADEALARLEQVLRSFYGVRIVQSRDNYLHAEFRTLLLNFHDDVEIFIDEAAGKIHLRSASRVGHSDLGANRRRSDAIRRRYLAGV